MQTLQSADSLRTSAPFRFTRMTGLGDFSQIGDTDLNNFGTVAFSAARSSDSSLSGIYTSRGRRADTIADTNSLKSLFSDVVDSNNSTSAAVYEFGSEVDINNRGNVLFEGKVRFLPAGSTVQTAVERLFLKQGNQFTKIAEVSDPAPSSFFSSTINFGKFSLNNRDQVVYATSTSTQSAQSSTTETKIVFDGKTIDSALASFGRFPSLGSVYNPVIIDNGTIVYAKVSGSPFASNTSILRLDPGATQSVTVFPTDLFPSDLSGVRSLAVNDQGTIVFSGQSRRQGTGVFQITPQGLTKLSDLTLSDVAINNRGTVAYQEGEFERLRGIVAQRDGTTTPVIAPGDVLFKNTVSEVDLGNINNRNQISFSAKFADGTVGVFRANLRRALSSRMSIASDEVTPDSSEDSSIEQIGIG